MSNLHPVKQLMLDCTFRDRRRRLVFHAPRFLCCPNRLRYSGFGRNISWKDDEILPVGHQITFKNALHVVTTDIFLKLIVPDKALGITERTKNVKLAFDELHVRF